MKRRKRKNQNELVRKADGSEVVLVLFLLFLNLTFMATSAWSRHDTSANAAATAQVQGYARTLPIGERQADQQWAQLILKPLRRLSLVVGLIPLVLILIAVYRDKVRNPLTRLCYGVVLITLTFTLLMAFYLTDLAGYSLLADKAYMFFSKQDFLISGLVMLLPGGFGVGLVTSGVTMTPGQSA